MCVKQSMAYASCLMIATVVAACILNFTPVVFKMDHASIFLQNPSYGSVTSKFQLIIQLSENIQVILELEADEADHEEYLHCSAAWLGW